MMTAVSQVLESVREQYWRAGDSVMRRSETRCWLRMICLKAGCDENQLPGEILELRDLADDPEKLDEPLELFCVMKPLLEITLFDAQSE